MSLAQEPIKALELFCSYSHEDEALLNVLEKHLSTLKRRGYVSTWHDRNISAGKEWESEISSHLNTAHIILLLISADFLASDYCYSIEMKRALERHAAGEARVVPIILRPVHWEDPSLQKLQVLPTNSKPVTTWPMPPTYDDAFLDIVRGLEKVVKELASSLGDHPGSLPFIWNIPYRRNPFFTGREDLLYELHSQLTAPKAAPFPFPLALSGLGGIGKTQTAIEYAYRHRDGYRLIWWVRAGTYETLISDFTALADALNLSEKEEEDQKRVIASVKHWLTTHRDWLLILDNVDDRKVIDDFLPNSDTEHILLTTRAQFVGGIASLLEVEKMNLEDGTSLLLRRANVIKVGFPISQVNEEERISAESVVRVMDGLPLALDQAGAYIEETGCSVSAYLDRYRHQQAALLKRRGDVSFAHPEPVATTWSLSFEQVEQTNPLAADLLRVCAFLAPDTIQEDLIIEGTPALGPLLSPLTTNLSLLDEAIGTLRRFSFLRRNREGKMLSIHRLVQIVLKESMNDDTQRQWAERVVRMVNRAFPEVEFATWSYCQQYLPHAQVCLDLMTQYDFSFEEADRLLDKAGTYLQVRAQYAEAEPFYRRALAIREQVLGPEHPSTARCLNDFARIYAAQKQYGQAESFQKRALSIREQVLGPEHPSTAQCLHNLASLYQDQGLYEQAQSFYERALNVREKALGPKHTDTAQTLNSLAALYRIQEQYEKAESFGLQALAIYEQTVGPEHPYTATNLINLALLYRVQHLYEKAEPLMKRALKIREQVLGPQHPSTISTQKNYHQLMRKLKQKNDSASKIHLD